MVRKQYENDEVLCSRWPSVFTLSLQIKELVGANLIMSIHPKYQEIFLSQEMPCEERIEKEIPADVIDRLLKLPEFVRSYEPDGMTPEEFISYGATQRTLSQYRKI
jgi:transaldolase